MPNTQLPCRAIQALIESAQHSQSNQKASALCISMTGDDRGECTILLAGLLQPTLLELSQSKQSNSKAPQQINDASAEAV